MLAMNKFMLPVSTVYTVCMHGGYLDNRVEQHNSRLLSDDLLGGEMMLDELRDGGKARPFKTVLTLPERERDRQRGRTVLIADTVVIFGITNTI